MTQDFFNQQVATLHQRLYALQQHLNAAPEAQRTQSMQDLEELTLALQEVQQQIEAGAAQRTGDAARQRYENAGARLLRWQKWTKEEKPLVRELLALIGKVLLEREDLAGAEHYLVRALQLSPSWDVARTLALVEERNGEQAQGVGELTQALTSYRQALAYDPCNQTYAQKITHVQSLYAVERRRRRWKVGRRAAWRVALGGVLVLLMEGRLWDARKAGERFQSLSLSHQTMPPSPFPVATVSSTAAIGESTQAVGGSAEEKSQGLGEALEQTAKAAEPLNIDEERTKEVQTVVTDWEHRQRQTTEGRRATASNRSPHIVASSPSAHALEIAVGAVQRFSVKASDPDKDDRLAYAWFLNGQEVARGTKWEFRAPSTPASAPRYQVKVEVSDRGDLKDHLVWNITLKLPSPLPRIVDAQPRNRKVVLQAGEALEFSVIAAVAGGSGEALQGLLYQWRVDDAPPQTTQTNSFRFVNTTPVPHRLTVIAISPEGFKSTPKGWIVEVRPSGVAPLPH